MIVTCSNCQHQETLDDRKLEPYAGKTVKIECPKCRHSIPFAVAAPGQPEENGTVILSGQASSRNAKLLVKANQYHQEQLFELTKASNIIGRLSHQAQSLRPDLAIQTQDLHMSKLHCQIEVEQATNGQAFVLQDYNSTNQTFLNGKCLEKNEAIYLNDGDRIKIGNTEIQFRLL